MKQLTLFLVGAALASAAQAQSVRNYWDFESTADVVGGVPTSAVGTPDLSIHPTYGEAYTGSGKSLNIVFDVQSYLIGDVHDGTNATAMDFGTDDFSFSYWSYNDTSDANTRGPRIFDFLDGTTTGIQLGTNATNIYNLRVDTSDGGATISNNTLGSLEQPADAWVQVAVNVDRTGSQLEIFFDGVSQGTVPLAAPSAGTVHATRDMDIGVINSDGTANQAEQSGLDDLAFYDGLLSASDVAGLADGSLTPLSFLVGSASPMCFGDGTTVDVPDCNCGNLGGAGEGCQNSTGMGALLVISGAPSVSGDTTVLEATQVPNQPGIFFQGDTLLGTPALFGDGIRCCGDNVLRWSPIWPDTNCASSDQPGGCGDDVGNGTGYMGSPTGHPGNSLVPGDSRCYQYWYRDPSSAGPCGGVAGFNLSNAYVVSWGA